MRFIINPSVTLCGSSVNLCEDYPQPPKGGYNLSPLQGLLARQADRQSPTPSPEVRRGVLN